jgi:hypothetical protein
MDNNWNKTSDKTGLPTKLKFENMMDTSGTWFAVAVLFAVLAAGIIIYRAANDDIRTASQNECRVQAACLNRFLLTSARRRSRNRLPR